MNPTADSSPGLAPRLLPRKLSRDTVFLIGDLLPLLDFAGVLLAAYLGTLVYTSWLMPGAMASGVLADGGRAALAAAVLAPFILCDRTFVAFASGGQTAALVRCYVARFVMFGGAVAAIGLASSTLERLPRGWLALWFVGVVLITALTRLLLVRALRQLERTGVLTETVAIVGAGPAARRLIRRLRRTRPDSVQVVGVFDDAFSGHAVHRPTGSIDDLVELGKSRSLDWILLTQRESDSAAFRAAVHRLKGMGVPIGWCAPDVRAPRPRAGWARVLPAVEAVVPRWIVTLLELPLTALRRLARRPDARAPEPSPPAPPRAAVMTLPLHDLDLDGFARIAARFGHARFGYAVTPNADHLIRLHEQPAFRASYAAADFVLLDSRFLARLLRFTRKLELPVCTGSDVVARLFDDVIAPGDAVVLVGGSAAQAADLRQRYALERLAHFDPPMGFIHDARAVEDCLQFVERHSPFRYCLLAVGSPQQEMLARALKVRGAARGLALCVGASVSFLTGQERRAPAWMQRHGLEWLYRLLRSPRRMVHRYLVRGPRVFALLRRTRIELCAAPVAPERVLVAVRARARARRLLTAGAGGLPAMRGTPRHSRRSEFRGHP